MRQRGARRGRVLEREPVLLMDENVFDGAKPIRPQPLRPVTRGFEAIRPMDPTEAHQAEARAVALFGMRPALEDARDEPPSGRTGLVRPRNQARRRPFGVRPMRAWHVRDLGGKPAPAGETQMRRETPPLEEDFHGRLGETGLDPFVDELIRHAVEIVIDFDVVIDIDVLANAEMRPRPNV